MSINRKEIIKNLSRIPFSPSINGLIHKYNLIINELPSDFWNSFISKTLESAGDFLYEDIANHLEDVAAECAYNFAHGVINSEEYKSICANMVKNKENLLESLFAVIAAFGWAKAEIIQLIPNELMIIRAYDYYESDIYDCFTNKKFKAFILKGTCRSFMDLVYGKPFPEGFESYKCAQIKGIEVGDFYGEFVVTKK